MTTEPTSEGGTRSADAPTVPEGRETVRWPADQGNGRRLRTARARRLLAVAVAMTAAGLAVATPGAYRAYESRRDEAGFLSSAQRWIATDRLPSQTRLHDQEWFTTDRPAAVAAGDAACAWLLRQPNAAQVDPTGRSTTEAVLDRHRRETSDFLPVSAETRLTVALAAWNHLCRESWQAKTSPRSSMSD